MYYHGVLTGLVRGFTGYEVESNHESGNGRLVIVLKGNIKIDEFIKNLVL